MDSKALLPPPVLHTAYLVLTSLLCVLSHISCAYLLVIISPAFFYLPQDVADVTQNTQGIAVFLFALAAMGGSLGCNLLADWLGRKKALAVSDLVLIVGTIVTISARKSGYLIAGRVVTGFGVGLIVTLNPVYIAELTPTRFRGACLSSLTAAWLVSEAAALGVSLATAPLWKEMVALGAVPALAHLAALWLWMPESPRWLVQQSRPEEAKAGMKRFYKGEIETIDAFLQAEIAGITLEIAQNQSNLSTFSLLSSLFSHHLPNFLYVNAYLVLFQLSGLAGIMYFSSQVMALVGFQSHFQANLAATVLFLLGAGACFVNMAIVDRLGRRWILLVFIPFQGASMLLMALGTYLQVYTSFSSLSQWLSLTALLSYFCFVNLSTAPLSGVIPPELFPVSAKQLQVRSFACGVGYSLGWVSAALVGISFLQIETFQVGKVSVWLGFAAANVVLWLLTYRYLREMKGIALESRAK